MRFPFSTNMIAHSSAQSVGNPCTLKCEELLWVKNSEIIWIVNLEFLQRQNGNQRFYNIVSNDSCILFMELLLEEEKNYRLRISAETNPQEMSNNEKIQGRFDCLMGVDH